MCGLWGEAGLPTETHVGKGRIRKLHTERTSQPEGSNPEHSHYETTVITTTQPHHPSAKKLLHRFIELIVFTNLTE